MSSQPPPKRVPKELKKNIDLDDYFTRLTNGVYFLWEQTENITDAVISAIQTDVSTLQTDVTTLQTQKPTIGTPVTLSGTSVDFTGIPSWVTKITVSLAGASSNGTSFPLFQLGDADGVEATGYKNVATTLAGSSVGSTEFTTGFALRNGVAANVIDGSITFVLENSSNNTWTASGNFSGTGSSIRLMPTAGSKTLSAPLDRIRYTTVNGTDEHDAGEINIWYE